MDKLLKSCGDVILPCATPELKVIVALSSLFVASLTVAPSCICFNKSTSGILNILITRQSAAWDMALKVFLKSMLTRWALLPSFQASCEMKCTFCMLMPTQHPCLPPPCPGSKMLAGSTIFFNRKLMTQYSSWYKLFSKTTGRWSNVLSVPPSDLCEAAKWCRSSLLAVNLCLVSKLHSPTLSQFGSWKSSSVIVFVSSLGHLSGFVLLLGFKHIATYFLISWLRWVLLSNGLVHALLSDKCQSVISPSKAGCLSRPCYAWSS